MHTPLIISTVLVSISMVITPLLGSIEENVEISDVMVQVDPIQQTMEVNLPEVTILPNSPFYVLKIMWEEVRLFLSRSPEQQLELVLQLANVRLAETLALINTQQPDFAQYTFGQYETLVAKSEQIVEVLTKDNTIDNTLNAKLSTQRETNKLAELLMGEYTIRWSK
ncbi:hypothetical protein COX05_04190 [candidate division WWE3 bacterium CG22_combo_CG10-13_8_21_14_all_39_12]|uniref:DUF5667 domain-containing protein n=2 Tax=Katanobacteria TaxID=422282 RepID=A0A2M7X346_UNCKA|nr:MAG: hypothetical protein COX05_04190 [candidate division WWE3 bacterium CG22_combo_CG10-13_8_21_14_all_39_12]PJA40583.1 MAG: hypothetical protein CO179_01835 [candidate division WWE3 bacterium CG_4_9_14_3_um_filter_39_7]